MLKTENQKFSIRVKGTAQLNSILLERNEPSSIFWADQADPISFLWLHMHISPRAGGTDTTSNQYIKVQIGVNL